MRKKVRVFKQKIKILGEKQFHKREDLWFEMWWLKRYKSNVDGFISNNKYEVAKQLKLIRYFIKTINK